jgi:hypothetical protein
MEFLRVFGVALFQLFLEQETVLADILLDGLLGELVKRGQEKRLQLVREVIVQL